MQRRRFDGYSIADTGFAGPTMFARGDTIHRNQHGALVAKEQATAIRYLVDEANMFNGALDRFNWKLVGKKEMIVPYNAFGMYAFNEKLHDVAMQNGLAADHRRYEVHRVWVVEATVKPTARHAASKKVFYLDEDSWLALVGDDYDAQGKLWKVRESYPIPVWELGGTCDNEPFVQYDLNSGRYVFDGSSVGQGKDTRWYQQVNDPRFKVDFFTAETLRAVSER